jgi:hypothetical protein
MMADTPVAGFYATRLVRNGIEVAVRVWHGLPVIDGDVQDRSPRWCVEIDGEADRWDEEAQCRVPLDLFDDDLWPRVAQRAIDADEYAFIMRRAIWARAHAPHHPAANPRRPIDLRTLPPQF